MKNEQILAQLAQKGIEIGVVEGKLKILDPDNNLNDELLGLLKERKQELIELLTFNPNFTLSDFPNAELSRDEFQGLLTRFPKMENLYVATPMQSGLLFHGLDDKGASYMSMISCDLTGDINLEAFKQSWQDIVSRYETFRTGFVGMEDNQIHQLVLKNAELPFEVLDWRSKTAEQQETDLVEFRRKDKAAGVNFEQPPLMRITMIRLQNDNYHFVWSHHHILSDGWCLPIIFKEVLACYQAYLLASTPQLPQTVPYERYIAWMRSQDKQQARSYWSNYLSGFTSPTPLQIDKLPTNGRLGSQRKIMQLDLALSDKLRSLVKSCHCTLSVAMQAAWAILLHRYSGEDDIMFGTPVSGRPAEIEGVERMMGLFINTIPVRAQFNKALTLGDLLKQMHQNSVASDEYNYIGLAEIQGLSDVPPRVPLFDSLLTFENYPTSIDEKDDSGELNFDISNVLTEVLANHGLTAIVHSQEQLKINLDYPGERFSDSTIDRLLSHLQQIFTAMTSGGANQKVSDIDILAADETQMLLNWGQSPKDYPVGGCLHHIFEEQARLHPDTPAVIHGDEQLSYRELNEQSNQLAHYLIEQGVKPDSLVALCIERSLSMYVGLFGIMKAGAAYVPVDPNYPQDRIEYMLENAGAEMVLTESHLFSMLPLDEVSIVLLDEKMRKTQMAGFSIENPPRERVNDSNLIYAIYTSGSTGQPKGVLVEHKTVVNFLHYSAQIFMPGSIQGAVVSAPLAFDGTVCTLYTPLMLGKTVELLPADDTAMDVLADYIFRDDKPLLFKLTPGHLDALSSLDDSRENLNSQHLFVVAGELLTEKALAPWRDKKLPNSIFFNEYGPTEASVGTTVYLTQTGQAVKHPSGSIPIGKPLANAELYVLNHYEQMQPVGVPGELYITGGGLARGYQENPELTREKFIEVSVPESASGGEVSKRMYRTGDLVRWLPDGNLEFNGRVDLQVKLRGFRIELGEIENQLAHVDGIRECVVLCRDNANGEKALVAYVVPSEALESEDEDILAEEKASRVTDYINALKGKLPQYMVPGIFVFLERFPLSPNGKVARNALPEPGEGDMQKEAYVAPRNETEARLCEIWQTVLKQSELSIHDDFFAMGGNSLLATRLISMIRESFGLEISVKTLFAKSTIAGFAEEMELLMRKDKLSKTKAMLEDASDDIVEGEI